MTGKAGAGKSHALKRLVARCRRDYPCIVVAPTGVAAINCGGSTIHKAFHLPITVMDKNDIQEVAIRQSKAVKHAEMLIIDELSMVRADIVDVLDGVLRQSRRNNRPFGGMKVVAFGDGYQLPPVAKREEWEVVQKLHGYESSYFFSSHVFRKHPPFIFDMVKIFRQNESEREFIDILNAVRDGSITPELLRVLNSRVRPDFTDTPGYVTLCPTNAEVESVNRRQLEKLPGEPVEFRGAADGDFKPGDVPADDPLRIKIGAQVMLTKNDLEGRWINGSIGLVTGIGESRIYVNVNGKECPVERVTWEKHKPVLYDIGGDKTIVNEKTGSYYHFPMRLGFAMSMHKVQGATIDRCVIQPDRIFEDGQLYVALSRCRSLGGIVLKSPCNSNSIRTNEHVIKWFADARESGMYSEVWQKVMSEAAVDVEQTKESSIVDTIRSGKFLSSDEIAEIRGMGTDKRSEVGSLAVDLLLDEIESLRRQVEELKRRKNKKPSDEQVELIVV